VVDRQVIIGAVRDITERRTAEDMLGEQHQQFLAILESFPEILYVTDPKTNEVLFANRELKDSLGNDPTGKICYEELQGLDAPCEFCTNAILFETREPHVWEYHNLKMDRYYSITDQLITWPDGREVRFEHAVDITDRKSAEGELLRHQEHLEELVQARTRALEQSKEKLTRQAQEILELSTPVMQVWQGVIVAPLIGTLDSQRTMQFMDRLLRAVVDTRSEVVLVDITGVPIADTQTAQNLVETAASVKLLGGHVVLTGVSPAIAQTLVRLGVDLSDVTTRSSLSSGIDYALSALGLRVESRRG